MAVAPVTPYSMPYRSFSSLSASRASRTRSLVAWLFGPAFGTPSSITPAPS
ncbi:Uncharacterised protein [Mycobacteroides abscessus subsp. abscessus]|nr:Uncharacterised protein [Mycobacteroides abscessus subsp. abscessus]